MAPEPSSAAATPPHPSASFQNVATARASAQSIVTQVIFTAGSSQEWGTRARRWHPCRTPRGQFEEQTRVVLCRRSSRLSPPRRRRHREDREDLPARGRQEGVLRPSHDARRADPEGAVRPRRGDRDALPDQRRRRRGRVRGALQEGRARTDQLVASVQEPSGEAQVGRRVPSRRSRAKPRAARRRQGPVGGREVDVRARASGAWSSELAFSLDITEDEALDRLAKALS